MAKLEPTDNFGLMGWMVTELRLAGYELVAYALVHQFSMKSKAGIYTGGVPYLASWLSCSLETARKYLHQLEEKGLIVSKRGTHDGVPYCYYQVIDTHIPKILRDTPKDLRDDTQNSTGGIPKNFGVEYKEEYKLDNNNNIPPAFADVVAYCKQRGFADPEGFADYYLENQKQGGWKRKDGKAITNWKQNVLQWERYNKNKTFPRTTNKETISVQQAKSKYGL